MTAPLPTPYLSPTAGLANALARHAIRLLTARETKLLALLAIETERRHALRTSANYSDSDRSGYIDHPFRTHRGSQ